LSSLQTTSEKTINELNKHAEKFEQAYAEKKEFADKLDKKSQELQGELKKVWRLMCCVVRCCCVL